MAVTLAIAMVTRLMSLILVMTSRIVQKHMLTMPGGYWEGGNDDDDDDDDDGDDDGDDDSRVYDNQGCMGEAAICVAMV